MGIPISLACFVVDFLLAPGAWAASSSWMERACFLALGHCSENSSRVMASQTLLPLQPS